MINKEIVICNMSFADITAVSNIENELFGELSQKLNFSLELESSTSYYIVAKIDNNIVGYAGIWNLFDHADIIEIGVKSSFQNLGIGSKLLSNMINYSIKNNLDKIFLEVRISNIIAQGLYKKFGFDIISLRQNYYRKNNKNNEDAIVMVKNLK